MKNIVIRCDAGNIPNLGTGHIVRCVTICKYLIKKFKINKNKFLFLIKTKNKYLAGKKILDLEKFNYKTLPNKIKDFSLDEINIIKRLNPKIILIDRLGSVNKNFLSSLKESKIRTILIDNKSYLKKKSDLYLNPLIFNNTKKNYKNQGYKYSIFPSLLLKKKIKPKKISKNKKIKIFLFFGGYDYNNIAQKILKLLNNIKNIEFIISKKMITYSKLNSYTTYNSKNFYEKMSISDYAIISGGLIVFDAIKYNLPIISIPQYLHQKKTLLNLKNKKMIKYVNLDKNLNKNILNLLNDFNYKPSIINNMKYFQKKFIAKLQYKKIFKEINKLYEN